MAETLNSPLYVPDKCPEPQLLGLLVHVMKDLQQGSTRSSSTIVRMAEHMEGQA